MLPKAKLEHGAPTGATRPIHQIRTHLWKPEYTLMICVHIFAFQRRMNLLLVGGALACLTPVVRAQFGSGNANSFVDTVSFFIYSK